MTVVLGTGTPPACKERRVFVLLDDLAFVAHLVVFVRGVLSRTSQLHRTFLRIELLEISIRFCVHVMNDQWLHVVL
jgi:hypothetical protein